jgi:hypothetical protein
MQALRRRLLVTTICLAASVFLSTGVSHAKKGGSKIKVKVEADLQPCGAVAPATSPCDPAGTPPEPDAEGTARHEKESKSGVVKKDEFKGKVKIPVDPSSQLGIIDEAAAEGADIRMILSRAGTDFAECLLEFDEVEDEDGEDQAEYKVDVRLKKGAVQAKKGMCDIDLLAAGIQSGIPDAKAGDIVTATLVVNSANRTLDVDFLQGILLPH